MTVFLEGVAAQFYRGIGAEVQYIAPFGRMNFFIGANNAGKSIVLNLIATHVAGAKQRGPKRLEAAEEHRGAESGAFQFAIGAKQETVTDLILKRDEKNIFKGRENVDEIRHELIGLGNEIEREDHFWICYPQGTDPAIFPSDDRHSKVPWAQKYPTVWAAIDESSGNDFGILFARQIEERIRRSFPLIHILPAKRVFGASDEPFDDLSGKGLLVELAKIQQANFNEDAGREKFAKINRFVQEVTGKPEARLEVPYERKHLQVHMDNKTLPLSSLGTGIHEVILIAAFATIHDGSIMCIAAQIGGLSAGQHHQPVFHRHPLGLFHRHPRRAYLSCGQ
jgi:hypothetical protein